MSSTPNNRAVLLNACGLAFSHPAAPGAHGFSLSVPALAVHEGEVLSLCGPSGSGKSTLLAILAGLLRPHAGEVVLETDHGPIDLYRGSASDWRQLRRHFGYVHQDPREYLNDRRAVADIVADPLNIQSLPGVAVTVSRATGAADRLRRAIGVYGPRLRRERRARTIEVLGLVGITPSQAERTPEALSGGQRQRIAIARALVASPRLVFLDEPTSALDVSVQASILELLHRLRARHERTAYVLVTHDLALARQLADRVAILDQGHVVEEGPLDDVFRAPASPVTRTLLGIATAGLEGLENPTL